MKFTNSNETFIGIDFSSFPNDFSVNTVMNKRSDGVTEIVSCKVIERNMLKIKKNIKHYERLRLKKAVK